MGSEMTVRLRPEWSEIPAVIEKTTDFFSRIPVREATTDTFTMVVCELIENAIKYGEGHDTPDTDIQVNVSVSGSQVTIQVTNTVRRDSQKELAELDRTLQWIRGFHDPFEAYLRRIREISREPINHSRSCLGIARIAYEAQADLDFVLGEENSLTVSAVARLP